MRLDCQVQTIVLCVDLVTTLQSSRITEHHHVLIPCKHLASKYTYILHHKIDSKVLEDWSGSFLYRCKGYFGKCRDFYISRVK